MDLIDLLEKRVFLAAHPSLPLLSSFPSAPANLFLDFDGDTTPGGRTQEAFSYEGDRGVFSAAEQEVIRSVWARVAEAFSPFNLNVTTIDPGADDVPGKTLHAVIGGESQEGDSSEGGFGPLNAFHGTAPLLPQPRLHLPDGQPQRPRSRVHHRARSRARIRPAPPEPLRR